MTGCPGSKAMSLNENISENINKANKCRLDNFLLKNKLFINIKPNANKDISIDSANTNKTEWVIPLCPV